MQQSGSPYNLRFFDLPDFIVFNKRSGFRTHRVNENQLGLVEVLSSKLKQELFVVHRLDKETSGLILFAKNKAAAATLAQQFESREVKKTYYFLTDQTLKKSDEAITVKSHIDKVEKKICKYSWQRKQLRNKLHFHEENFGFSLFVESRADHRKTSSNSFTRRKNWNSGFR